MLINKRTQYKNVNFPQMNLLILYNQNCNRTFLVIQSLGIHLQETWVQSLAWEDPTCQGATDSKCHNYWACSVYTPRAAITEPTSPRAQAPQGEATARRRLYPATRESPSSKEDPEQPKKNRTYHDIWAQWLTIMSHDLRLTKEMPKKNSGRAMPYQIASLIMGLWS